MGSDGILCLVTKRDLIREYINSIINIRIEGKIIPRRRSYYNNDEYSGPHRLKIRYVSLYLLIFIVAVIFAAVPPVTNIGWVWVFIGILAWVFALIFDIREILSDLILIISGVIIAWGFIQIDIINVSETISSAVYYILIWVLISIMKYGRQMAVHFGTSISGFAVVFGWFFLDYSAPIIGIISGMIVLILFLFLLSMNNWNSQICIGFLIILSLILCGWLVISGASDATIALISYILAIPGPILCALGIVDIPQEPMQITKKGQERSTKVYTKSTEDPSIAADLEEDVKSEISATTPKVFLSHSHEDKEFVNKLASDLQKAGIRTWVDEAEILVGESLLKKIATAIDSEVDFVAAILSKRSVESGWVQKELELAMNKEIPNKEVVVLPLIIEDCAIPTYLKGKLYLRFESDAYCSQVDVLIDHINKHYSRKSKPKS
jgi:hypothetical protein